MSHDGILNPQLRVFATLVLLGFLGWVVYLIRYHRLSLRDSLLWFLSTLTAFGVTVFPRTLEVVTRAIGIATPSNALFALTFAYVLLNLLATTLAVSSNATRIRRVAQECALLRAELDELRRAGGPPPAPGPVSPSSGASARVTR